MMNGRPVEGLPVRDAAAHLHRKYPNAPRYPTYNQILTRAYDAVFETEVFGRHRIIPDRAIPAFERAFGFGVQPPPATTP